MKRLKLKLLHCMCCHFAMKYQDHAYHLSCTCEDPLNPCIECNRCSMCCICTLKKNCAYLENIGYQVEPVYPGGNHWVVKAPSWQCDLVMSPKQITDHVAQLQEQRGDA